MFDGKQKTGPESSAIKGKINISREDKKMW